MNYPRVAVIGGGIAGAVACLRLVDSGTKPLWIAPVDDGHNKHGEHLSAAARPLLEQVNALHLLERPYHRQANVILSSWGSDQIAERNSIVHLEGPGTIINRSAFEQDLVNEVIYRGVPRRNVMLRNAHYNQNRWELELEDGSETADYLIDASGRHSIIAKQQSPRFRSDQLVAVIAFLEQNSTADITPTRATLIEAVADGWWYATLLADGRLVLNYYTDPDLLPKGICSETSVFNRMLKQTRYIGRWVNEAEFELKSSPRLTSAGTTWIAPAAGEGWIAIGDAAASFDPLSSHGMTTAFWTAIIGADAATAYLAGNREPSVVYTSKVAAGIQEFLNSRISIYQQEGRFKESPFWTRRVK